MDFAPKQSKSGFECGMDGYSRMTIEIVDLLIALISLNKEILIAILGDSDWGKAFNYGYEGLVGVNSWIGYIVAGVYYISEDVPELADALCEASGYAYVVIDALHAMVSFSSANDKSDDNKSSGGYETYDKAPESSKTSA